jgi:hypothetical protein
VLLLSQAIRLVRRRRTIGGRGFPPRIVRWKPIALAITTASVAAA